MSRLLAVGRARTPTISALDRAGVATDSHGYVQVDDTLESNVRGIWALGDCNGRGAFTHTSYNDFEIVAANLLDGEQRSVKDRLPGYALYIDPPLGRVGMSESEARKSGRRLLVAKRPMTRVSRAIEKGETQGFMKVVADADSRQILGAAILGTGGDEAIHGVIDMMHARVPYPVYQWAVPIHPTVSRTHPDRPRLRETDRRGLSPAAPASVCFGAERRRHQVQDELLIRVVAIGADVVRDAQERGPGDLRREFDDRKRRAGRDLAPERRRIEVPP